MGKQSITSIALKWHFFTYIPGVNVHAEYFNLFMKQLGFNPAQIAVTTLMGLPNIFIMLYLLLGEKFQARKTVLVIVAVGLLVCCVLPLLSLIVPALKPTCYSETSTDSFDAKQQAPLRNAPAHLLNADNTKNLKRSVVLFKNITHLFRLNVATQHFGKKNQASSSILRNNSSHHKNPKYATHFSKIHHPQPWLSALFLVLILSRSQTMVMISTDMALANLATITYLKEEKASYGAYLMWGHVGLALSISFVAGLAWLIKIPICGIEKSGYFMAFIWAFVITFLSMLSLPWFKFEYNEKKSFNWSGLKPDVFNAYFICMLITVFYTGLCLSFQVFWEFWYLDGLSASPLLLGGAVLIRRPAVALSMLFSTYLIRKIGDLKTICLALFLYFSSFLALSFIRIAWLVLMIDTLQATAYGISYCAFTTLFYKAASTENWSIILGLQETVFAVGYESGSTLMGVLFHALGTQVTLLLYSTSCAAVLVILLLYVSFSKYDHGYHKLAQGGDKE